MATDCRPRATFGLESTSEPVGWVADADDAPTVTRLVRPMLRLILALVGVTLGVAIPPASAVSLLTACGTLAVPGSYALAGDIVTKGTCFTVTDNVGLDLRGHAVTGDGTGSGITDGKNSLTGIIITNGRITNFATGIDLSQSSVVTIEGMDVSNNLGTGISAFEQTTITRTRADGNGGDGIALKCCNTVTSSAADRNTGNGIAIGGCCSTVSNTEATRNGRSGILVTACCSTVTQSRTYENGGDGIHTSLGINSVTGSEAHDNGGKGIVINGNTNSVANSQASTNGSDGIFGDGCCATVARSQADGNTGNGITLAGGKSAVTYTRANGNAGHGISIGVGVQFGGDANTVTNDVTSGNQHDGTLIQCPSNVLRLRAQDNPDGNLVASGTGCTLLHNRIRDRADDEPEDD
jgi:hypothetical protein